MKEIPMLKNANIWLDLKAKITSNSTSMASLLVSLCFLQISGCAPNGPSTKEIGRGGSSRVSEIKVGVSGLDNLTAGDGTKPVTGIHLTVIPDSSCAVAGTSIDTIMATRNSTALQQKVAKGCGYDIRVELGRKDPTDSNSIALLEVFYAASQSTRITASDTVQDNISVKLSLALTDAGRNAGLPEKPNLNPTPNPTPNSSSTTLAANLNVSLQGQNSLLKLADVFTTDYLLVDFSRPGCGPCVQLAQEHEASAEFKALTTGTKCRAATIIPEGELSDWITTLGGSSTRTAKESYEYNGGHSGFATLFGVSISATPTFIITDRSGHVLDEAVGSLPTQFRELCGN
jgi:hypothetical protein